MILNQIFIKMKVISYNICLWISVILEQKLFKLECESNNTWIYNHKNDFICHYEVKFRNFFKIAIRFTE